MARETEEAGRRGGRPRRHPIDPEPHRPRGMVACVTVIASPDRDAVGRIHLLGSATYIGREPAEPELVWIADLSLAMRHCRILREQDRFTLEDLGANAGGTFVNGQPVTQGELHRCDLIRCGETLLLLGELDMVAVRWLHPRHSGLVGKSSSLIQALRTLGNFASESAPIALLGEPGTGRERLAWELHRLSGRGGPLLSYDCRATPASAHAGDLFGREAQTADGSSEVGLFELARRGTLFLGNVEWLAPEAIVRLRTMLRTTRPGRGKSRIVHPRVVVSAPELAPAGAKPDLLRLLELCRDHCVSLAPTRERREDILPLFQRFLVRASPVVRRRRLLVELHIDLQEALLLQPWPGNFDGLQAAANKAALLLDSAGRLGGPVATQLGLTPARRAQATEAAELAQPQPQALPPPPPPGQAPDREALIILQRAFHGSVRRLAMYLGRDRRLVYRWLARHGLLDVSGAD